MLNLVFSVEIRAAKLGNGWINSKTLAFLLEGFILSASRNYVLFHPNVIFWVGLKAQPQKEQDK